MTPASSIDLRAGRDIRKVLRYALNFVLANYETAPGRQAIPRYAFVILAATLPQQGDIVYYGERIVNPIAANDFPL